MGRTGFTRRGVLAAMLAPAARPRIFPPERVRYADPATEFWVLRLTSPDHSSMLPPPPLRAVTRRRTYLFYANDRTGAFQLFRMNATTGESRQLTNAVSLDRGSFTLTPDDRGLLYFDGPALRLLGLPAFQDREIYRPPAGWRRAPGLSVSQDGATAFLAETDGAKYRLRLVPLAGQPATVLEAAEPLGEPQPRPGHPGLLYRRGPGAVWLDDRPLPLAPGGDLDPYWSADGERVLYLNRGAIREFALDPAEDRLVAATSQFACFAPNGDGTVFIGASASKASPYILLLLRATRREMALCEHKSSDPARAWPVFSPDSQRIYFQSDRHGKPALYSMGVDRLVERTG